MLSTCGGYSPSLQGPKVLLWDCLRHKTEGHSPRRTGCVGREAYYRISHTTPCSAHCVPLYLLGLSLLYFTYTQSTKEPAMGTATKISKHTYLGRRRRPHMAATPAPLQSTGSWRKRCMAQVSFTFGSALRYCARTSRTPHS